MINSDIEEAHDVARNDLSFLEQIVSGRFLTIALVRRIELAKIDFVYILHMIYIFYHVFSFKYFLRWWPVSR